MIAIFVYPLHYPHGSVVVFLVNVATIGIGTLFRFWAYKRFVFLHPDRVQRARARSCRASSPSNRAAPTSGTQSPPPMSVA